MLAELSDDERALVPGIDTNVGALQLRIQSLVGDIRLRATHANGNADLPRGLLTQLDSLGDTMHAVRLDLKILRDARFERGLDEFNRTSERARGLSRGF
ncbi:MAG: hypothetical protein ABJE47_07465 [bacterium]